MRKSQRRPQTTITTPQTRADASKRRGARRPTSPSPGIRGGTRRWVARGAAPRTDVSNRNVLKGIRWDSRNLPGICRMWGSLVIVSHRRAPRRLEPAPGPLGTNVVDPCQHIQYPGPLLGRARAPRCQVWPRGVRPEVWRGPCRSIGKVGTCRRALAGSKSQLCGRCGARRWISTCLLYTSPSPRDATLSRMPSSA